MPHFIKYVRTLTVCLSLLLSGWPGNLMAQSDKEPTPVRFRITRFDPTDRPPPAFFVTDGTEAVPVKVPVFYIAGPYKAVLRGDRFLDFYLKGKSTPALTADIPRGEHKDLLLIFVPKKKEGYSVMAVDMPRTKLRGGDRFLVNASDTTVAIKYGKSDPVVIPPRGTGRVSGPGGKEILSLPVLVMEKTEKGWRLASKEQWPYDPRTRKILFIHRSERTKHLKFHGVSDRVDLPPPESEETPETDPTPKKP